ncbi:MAG: tRNA 2-selenouridine(34) synthase MnmH [Chitinophagaceae bacterium]|jgi:tRNA 2-selenouridine synthase|nr:tRNA 2-selenouridine(34) synthase MnmH [Chitinophagaceae bacterium]
MAIEKIHIEHFLQLAEQFPVIDVRSPAEYLHAHLPGAINLPLFNNEERKIVGTLYKQKSREDAIKAGLEFFGPKMRSVVESAESITSKNANNIDTENRHKTILIHCWRGGMRSGAIAWLLDLYGFKIFTLTGGYKSFRNHVLSVFDRPIPIHILGGYTGSGKTEILKVLEKHGQSILDLESLAKHKGSAFGNIDMPAQPSQEMFENLLAIDIIALNNEADIIWVEDESQRIGQVNIPTGFWEQMRTSPVFFLNIPFEKRLNHLVEEYGGLDKEKMMGAIIRIQKRLGGVETRNALLFLEQNDMKSCFHILLKYYDKYYIKALHNRDNIETLIQMLPCESVQPENVKTLLNQLKIHENP